MDTFIKAVPGTKHNYQKYKNKTSHGFIQNLSSGMLLIRFLTI